jgi:O-antigen ligase
VALVLCSNSASNLLIAAAFAALVIGHFRHGDAIRFPPVKLPLGLFFGATVAAVALSGHTLHGWPGIRKFYLCFVLLLVASTFRRLSEIRALVMAMVGVMTLSAVGSFAQFWRKMQEAAAAHQDFRAYYTVKRITGFTSHWMTLSGEEMVVLLMAGALVLFAARDWWTPWVIAGIAAIAVSLVLGYTRSMWMGAALGGGYLVWNWKRWWLLTAPVPLVLLLVVNPFGVGERIRSAWKPAGDLDSNQFRVVCRRAGWEIVKAHPWFGIGPEQVNQNAQLMKYIPADEPRPLPTGAYIHLHNVYLQYAAERGVPALVFFLWFVGKMLLDFIQASRRRPNFALYGAIAVMIAVLSAGWYEFNLGDGEILTVFLAVVACGYVAVAPEDAKGLQ